MSLKLRRIIWDDGTPSRDSEDYTVIDERGEKIGRMYRTAAVGGDGHIWRWTVYGIAVYNIPPAGAEPTREKATRQRGRRASRGSEAAKIKELDSLRDSLAA